MNGKRVLVGLSGGINSAAVLCWLIDSGYKPSELHLYYAHFKEHSPDTFGFVADLIRHARKHFKDVRVTITKNSVIDFFRRQKMIPHPAISPCSRKMKIEPMSRYGFDNRIEVDLIGYVKKELKRRADGAYDPQLIMFEATKAYPIGEFTDEWCFEIVKKHIGWYPAIYDIRDSQGNRVFKHNNCLPCKHMYPEDLQAVNIHFPPYMKEALKLSSELSSYWGRDEAEFYTTWGRELGQESTCEACKF